MKLAEIKQGLIEKFIKQSSDGVGLLEANELTIKSGSILGKNALKSTEELLEFGVVHPFEILDVNKAFDHFTNGVFNTLMAIDESNTTPKVLYIAVREYRKYSHINCTEGTPIPTLTSIGGIKKSMIDVKQLNEDVKFLIGHK